MPQVELPPPPLERAGRTLRPKPMTQENPTGGVDEKNTTRKKFKNIKCHRLNCPHPPLRGPAQNKLQNMFESVPMQ